MERKIALVGPHDTTNYGTILQAYALSREIRELVHECEYINYTPYYTLGERIIRKVKRILYGRSLGNKLIENVGIDDMSFICGEEFEPLRKSSRIFIDNNIPSSEVLYTSKTVKNTLPVYDRFIVGSDQSWSEQNYELMKGFYMLPFIKSVIKCFAYGPSLGSTLLTDEYAKILKRNLNKFADVSCREKAGSENLSRLLNRRVKYVLDPTMLLSCYEWRLFSQSAPIEGGYILAYILGEKKCISQYAEEIGRVTGLPVYYVCTRPKYLNKKHRLPVGLSPQQWVNTIDKAFCVVTDSFHGTIFSIKLETDFYVFAKREEGTPNAMNDSGRIFDLLKSFNLEDRFVEDSFDRVAFSHVKFDAVTPLVENLRTESLKYLINISGRSLRKTTLNGRIGAMLKFIGCHKIEVALRKMYLNLGSDANIRV